MFRSVCNFVWVDVGERRRLVCPIKMEEKGVGTQNVTARTEMVTESSRSTVGFLLVLFQRC